jgi:hypothetical protein
VICAHSHPEFHFAVNLRFVSSFSTSNWEAIRVPSR